MNGILNIHKATGMTSHDVVAKVRKLLQQKRVGHAGTLDPAARGVLPICVGQATRVAEYLSESGKAYEAELIFGVVTDTYDAEGSILRTASTAELSQRQIEAVLPSFLGTHLQLPPRYSAIKLQGQPAYKRVRAGEEITLEPRPITITHLEVLFWDLPRLTLAIECSKGTYIRSLAYDLGEQVGCGAHLAGLMRTRSGPFYLANSITLEQLASAVAAGKADEYLISADSVLHNYPAIQLDAPTEERVLHGNTFRYDLELPEPYALARVYATNGRFLAIAEWDTQQELWKPKKVFTSQIPN